MPLLKHSCGWLHGEARHTPSTVTTCMPSTLYSGARQALTERCHSCPSPQLDTMTVHAPHPPSPQPSLVPVRPSSAHGAAVLLPTHAGWLHSPSVLFRTLAFGSAVVVRLFIYSFLGAQAKVCPVSKQSQLVGKKRVTLPSE